MKIVNLTRKTLWLYDTAGALVETPPDARHLGVVAVGEHRTARDEAGHTFSLNVRTITEVKGMPPPEDGTVFLVPVEVAMALQDLRDDVFFPAEETVVQGPDGGTHRVTHLRRIVSRLK